MLDAPDSTSFGQGNHPLHYAAYEGHTHVVEELIARGCDVNARNELGATPLFFAAQQEQDAVVDLLLAASADPGLGEATHAFLPVDVASGSCRSRLLAAGPGLAQPEAPSTVEASAGSGGTLSVRWAAAAQARPLRGFHVAVWRAGDPDAGPDSVRPQLCGPELVAWVVRPRYFGEPLLYAVRALGPSAPSEWTVGEGTVTPCTVPETPPSPRCVGVSRVNEAAVRCRLQWAAADVDSRGSAIIGWELLCCFVSLRSRPRGRAAVGSSTLAQELKLPPGWLLDSTLTLSFERSVEGADPCDVPERGAVVFRLAALNSMGRSAFSGGTVVAASDATSTAASDGAAEAAADAPE